MYEDGNTGQVGCSLFCLEIITFIKFQLIKPGRELILPKEHAASLLYGI